MSGRKRLKNYRVLYTKIDEFLESDMNDLVDGGWQLKTLSTMGAAVIMIFERDRDYVKTK